MFLLTGCGVIGSNTPYYLHWNCNNVSACESAWGANIGIENEFSSQTLCDQQLSSSAASGSMPIWNGQIGDWCDTSNSTSESSP